MADVLDTPLAYHPCSGGALGIAFLAGYAVGIVDDFRQIKTGWLHGPGVTQPDRASHAEYDRLYPIYCEFDRALAEPFAELAVLTQGQEVALG
jgi:sugar (pentulose or hexulose) kinase